MPAVSTVNMPDGRSKFPCCVLACMANVENPKKSFSAASGLEQFLTEKTGMQIDGLCC